ncbi:MAG TPA: nitrile hydratase accessory protein [Acidimicrobiia bacterium]|nr:nitrile hydratase accessory protein [Acidimicrobiia bacterium]
MSDTFADDVATMTGADALPRANGELLFDAPWEGRAVALAVVLVERLGVPWDRFRRHLMAAIAEQPDRPYYESWAAALEAFTVEQGLADPQQFEAAIPTERPPL